jgi:hypothetical protein
VALFGVKSGTIRYELKDVDTAVFLGVCGMKSVSFLTLAVVFSRIALKVLKNTSFHFIGSRVLFFYF